MRGYKKTPRPSLKARLAERRERNLELARLDRANRCAVCKIALTDRPAIQVVGQPEKYCSACYADCFSEDYLRQMREAGE